MVDLNFVPEEVNLRGWAGDTLGTVTVTAPTAFIAGRVWTAQVRATPDATDVDATLVIIEPTTTDGPARLYLRAVDSARLVAEQVTGSARFTSASTGAGYEGVWDCQLTPAGGGDPTTTLVHGKVTILGDVSRLA